MVTCHVCKKEVIAGWICGVIPAHDKYKLGLCPAHDTPSNRALVEKEWDQLLQGELVTAFSPEIAARRSQTAPPVAYEVRIVFLDGGVKVLRCNRFEVTSDKDLLLLDRDGRSVFYPLQHIRSFETREVHPHTPSTPA
jgi:hypothetical protein